jgi:hypothetical protein
MHAFDRARLPAAVAVLLGFAQAAAAHHSYAMFDGTRTATVKGTVAKLEWTNPHVFVWVYVPNGARENGFDLYAFENGSPNVLARLGWSKTTLAGGEELTVDYWPLADGRTGGHFARATRADGTVLRGAGGPRGVDGALSLDGPAAAGTP